MLPLLMENFLLYLEGEKKDAKTIEAYRANLKSFAEFALKEEPSRNDYKEITVDDIMDWINYLRETRNYSASTLNQNVATIKKFYGYLVGVQVIEINVAHNIGTIKTDELFQRVILTEKEVVTLIEHVHEVTEQDAKGYAKYCAYRDELIVNLFICTGTRIEELSKINISDINFETRELKIVGKRKKKRVVVIPNSKMDMLLKFLSVRETLKSSKRDDALFLSRQKSENGYRLSTDQIRRVVVRLAKNAGVKSITPHSLRHTGATLQIKNGADIMDVSKWLGHSTVAITEKIYIHQTNESACRVADIFDGMF